MSFLPIVGAGLSAFGTLESGLYASQVSSNNAQIARQNADYTEKAGFAQAVNQSMKGAAAGARLKTELAANGVDVNTGSAADVETSQRAAATLDTENVLNNAELSAYGYTTQANNFEAQSQQDTEGAIFGAAGSLAEKASGLNWGKWGTTGPSDTDDTSIHWGTPL